MKDSLRDWVPRWWAGDTGRSGRIADVILWPAEGLFGAGVWSRNKAYDLGLFRAEAAPLPVISVGNIGVGGAGKTPVAAWLVALLASKGRRPAVVLRGYGADEIAVHRELNPAAPVITASRRLAGAYEAAERGCDVIVLDDAFQHRAIRRDLDLVLVSAEQWSGNRRLLPRGPWRERATALRRADVVMVTRKTVAEQAARQVAEELADLSGRSVVGCHIQPTSLTSLAEPAGEALPLSALNGSIVVAVTSLADPRPFVQQLAAAGARVELISYPDHHPFSMADAHKIYGVAGNRPIVMTRKEAVKLRGVLPACEALVLNQSVKIEMGRSDLDRAISHALERDD
ncbi:MAG TPA: tetraacyldisaccharide 4'-kinase [Longimicrobiaceae bacterium]|nr:tetraacyldisaccharide 4'-kinase [Longimicrobiaceae bacterium]